MLRFCNPLEDAKSRVVTRTRIFFAGIAEPRDDPARLGLRLRRRALLAVFSLGARRNPPNKFLMLMRRDSPGSSSILREFRRAFAVQRRSIRGDRLEQRVHFGRGANRNPDRVTQHRRRKMAHQDAAPSDRPRQRFQVVPGHPREDKISRRIGHLRIPSCAGARCSPHGFASRARHLHPHPRGVVQGFGSRSGHRRLMRLRL